MKRLMALALVILLGWAMAPSLGELLENAVHYVQEGHSAHAETDGDHHEPVGPEHGCSGVVHNCSCCGSLSFLTAMFADHPPVHRASDTILVGTLDPPTATLADVFHPPRA